MIMVCVWWGEVLVQLGRLALHTPSRVLFVTIS